MRPLLPPGASRRLPARSILVPAGSALPLGGHGRPTHSSPYLHLNPGATIREPAPLPTLRSAVRRAAAARIELLLPRRGAASWRAPFPATCLDDGARAGPPPWYSSLSSQAAVAWRSPTAVGSSNFVFFCPSSPAPRPSLPSPLFLQLIHGASSVLQLRQRSRLDGEGGGRCSAVQLPCGL